MTFYATTPQLMSPGKVSKNFYVGIKVDVVLCVFVVDLIKKANIHLYHDST